MRQCLAVAVLLIALVALTSASSKPLALSKSTILTQHNYERARYGVTKLKRNARLASAAEKFSRKCNFLGSSQVHSRASMRRI